MSHYSRRGFLKLGASSSVALTATLGSTRLLRAEWSNEAAGRIEAFPLDSVRLTPASSRNRRISMSVTLTRSPSIASCIPSASMPAFLPLPHPIKVGNIPPANCAVTSPGATISPQLPWHRQPPVIPPSRLMATNSSLVLRNARKRSAVDT